MVNITLPTGSTQHNFFQKMLGLQAQALELEQSANDLYSRVFGSRPTIGVESSVIDEDSMLKRMEMILDTISRCMETADETITRFSREFKA